MKILLKKLKGIPHAWYIFIPFNLNPDRRDVTYWFLSFNSALLALRELLK